jgi:hypothetical protein
MKIFDLIPGWIYALAVALLVGAVAVYEVRLSAAKLELANYRSEVEKAARQAEQEAREKEQQLQAGADQIRKDKEREIREITARNTALVNSLRNRPERPKGGQVSDPARACSGASGAELARGDGEFLAGYGSDAARLAAALDSCIKQYESARKALSQ